MTLSGMTGFGRADGALGDWSWTVEARSVNGRSLEARYRGPPGFDGLERVAREVAQARFQRGQINIGVQARRSDSAAAVRVNVEQLERYLAVGEPYVRDGRASPPTLDGLFSLRGVIEAADEAEDADKRSAVETAMAASIATALDALKAARLAEGDALEPVLLGLIDRIEALIASAEGEAVGQPAILKERYAKRISELVADRASLEDRIVQEAAALALKADVREELDRLTTHVIAARGLINGDGASGRRLDFLTQEFMRETNTLCAKAATSDLTAIGLDLKAVVDQLREQVQNVE